MAAARIHATAAATAAAAVMAAQHGVSPSTSLHSSSIPCKRLCGCFRSAVGPGNIAQCLPTAGVHPKPGYQFLGSEV